METRYDDYSEITRFRDVPIGCTFSFSSGIMGCTRWLKISPRKYRGVPGGALDGIDLQVGSNKAGVKDVRRGVI